MQDLAVQPPLAADVRSSRLGAKGADYALSLLMVAVAAVAGVLLRRVMDTPNVTLVFVLPVVIAGAAFGLRPALAAAAAGVLAFDFFFTLPYLSFRIHSRSDAWAAVLLLVIAFIVSSVAARSRRRAVDSLQAAERAEALHALAEAALQGRPIPTVLAAAAAALNQIFHAPAVIVLQEGGSLRIAARAGSPRLTADEEEAALAAMEERRHVRAETYPYDRSRLEFWPAPTLDGDPCALGVDFTAIEGGRPSHPERFVEHVAAHLALALSAHARAQRQASAVPPD
jgi:K+-sensing histidine kinase KdpD